MKRLNLTLALAAICLSGFSGYAAEPSLEGKLSGGTGTKEDPFIIATAADVMTLAKICNAKSVTNACHYADTYFKVTADIDMKDNADFIGIGTAPVGTASNVKYGFSGKFDGGGHKIKNMHIEGIKYDANGKAMTTLTASASKAYIGFFGNLLTGAEVKNLIIDSTCYIKGGKSVGGIAGGMGTNGPAIINCANYATVEAVATTSNVGGIVGEIIAPSNLTDLCYVKDCFNAGTVKAMGQNGGGIAGLANYAKITGCANIGHVITDKYTTATSTTTPKYAAGIAGQAKGVEISDCLNLGDIYSASDNVGGIAGYDYVSLKKGGMSNCINAGTLRFSSAMYCGALIGRTGTASTSGIFTVPNCYYDIQNVNTVYSGCGAVWNAIDDAKPVDTEFLVSGTLPQGLEASAWKAEKGYYPIPAALSVYPELRNAAATYLVFPTDMAANHFVGTATLSTYMKQGSIALAEDADKAVFSVSANSVTAKPTDGITSSFVTINNGDFTRSLPLTSFNIPFTGKGTETDPYLISSAEDMRSLETISRDALFHWDDNWFRMTKDIDMASIKDFKGIGAGPSKSSSLDYKYYFSGKFDGQGNTISNLDLTTVVFDADGVAQDYSKGSYLITGLFGTLGEDAVIRNLNLDSSCKVTGLGNMGCIAGLVCGAAEIENCTSAATVTAYHRYVGGIFGRAQIAPIKVINCLFSGQMISNYDYLGGVVGWAQYEKSVVSGCANTAPINVYRFNSYVSEDTEMFRVGGIGANSANEMSNCINYGPINIVMSDSTVALRGVGGICGQNSNNVDGCLGTFRGNINVGQIMIKGAKEWEWIGNIMGSRYIKAGNPMGEVAYNYCDTTLNMIALPADNVTEEDRPNYVACTTEQLTSGSTLPGLADAYVFEKGYYPMPKALSQNPVVRAAAATFMTLPEGQSIREIKTGAEIKINNVMPLTANLESDLGFKLENNILEALASKEPVDNKLTLKNGTYYNVYPLHKLEGENVGIEELSAESGLEISSVKYYSLDGRTLGEAQEGTVTVAVITYSDGTRKAIRIAR